MCVLLMASDRRAVLPTMIAGAVLLLCCLMRSEGNTTPGRASQESRENEPVFTKEDSAHQDVHYHTPPARHHVVLPRVHLPRNDSRKQDFPEEVHVKLSVLGRQFTLRLELNRIVAPASHQFHEADQDGIILHSQSGASSCYYQGHVDTAGVDRSATWAAVSTCRGLSGSFYDGSEVYVVEPVRKSDRSTVRDKHFLYKLSEIESVHEHTECGHPHLHNKNVTERRKSSLKTLEELSHPRRVARQAQWDGWRFVELMFVVDNNMIEVLGGRNNIQDFVLQAANIMDMIYKQIQVRIALTTVVLWSRGNPIRITTDPKETLNTFLSYREKNWLRTSNTPHDNAQLISATDFAGATVGLGRLNSMCSTTGSGGISQHKRGHPATMVATVVAHEMGHNLNMQHDDGRACNDCPRTKPCLMAATAGPRSTHQFSRCSREDKDSLINAGGAHCLSNRPTKLFADPVCGNGFKEAGEECDCGSERECVDRCCDARSCRLTQGSQCAGGDCCQNCQFMRAGSRCRQKKNTCDLEEFCTGVSAECPDDSVYRNGLPCSLSPLPGNAYCWNGECLTITTQCQSLWGPQGEQAHDLCYDRLNVVGNQFGNCGKRGSNYLPCGQKDVLCGQLQCNVPPSVRYPVIGLSKTARQVTYQLGNQRITCRQASVDLGADIPDPGLTVDGTVCGRAQVCMSKQCISVNSIRNARCPTGPSGLECSGRGVCDDRLRCHCRAGFYPPHCGATRPPPGSVQPTYPGLSTSFVENPLLDPNAPHGLGNPDVTQPDGSGDSAPGGSPRRLSTGMMAGIGLGALFFLMVILVLCCPGCVFAKCPGCRPKCLGGADAPPPANRTRFDQFDRKQPPPTSSANLPNNSRLKPQQNAQRKVPDTRLLPVGSGLAAPAPSRQPHGLNSKPPQRELRSALKRPNTDPPALPGRAKGPLHRPPIAPPNSAPPRPAPRKR
eukprot:scpid20454/ scgid0186/ Disintegrin and metalloproteinase domain-containing protein 9; Meltrin-gamma; Metalloprotease/disintegrin/cysteine-rich protein 9; Myeloma cell metalloproteinase